MIDPITVVCLSGIVLAVVVPIVHAIHGVNHDLVSGGPPVKLLPESAEDRYYRIQREERALVRKEFDDAVRAKYGPSKEELRIEQMKQQVDAMKSQYYYPVPGYGMATASQGTSRQGGHGGKVHVIPYPPLPPQFQAEVSVFQSSLIAQQQQFLQQMASLQPPQLTSARQAPSPHYTKKRLDALSVNPKPLSCETIEHRHARAEKEYRDWCKEISK